MFPTKEEMEKMDRIELSMVYFNAQKTYRQAIRPISSCLGDDYMCNDLDSVFDAYMQFEEDYAAVLEVRRINSISQHWRPGYGEE